MSKGEVRVEKELGRQPRIPGATYRLQFSREFTFGDAAQVVDYLDRLGITDIYSSPYLKATEGSLHGYDIVDPTALNPEIGSDADYDGLIDELRKRAMGQVLDIVPNHMCIGSSANSWWMDVLENGPGSPYASFFDIDWEPVKKELKDKVLLPILGDQYGRVLENQELQLLFEGGGFSVVYYEHKFPVRPHSWTVILEHRLDELKARLGEEDPDLMELLSIITAAGHLPPYTEVDPEKVSERQREKEVIKKRLMGLYDRSGEIRTFIDGNVTLINGVRGEPRSFDLLDALLSEQVYRLSNWRVATEEINYRRFFDINSLGAIRVEDPAVFSESHRLILELVRTGKVTGLRIDHPDGLFNPLEYFRLLQKECFIQARLGLIERTHRDLPEGCDEEALEEELGLQYLAVLGSDPAYKAFYIVGEKILLKSERMPDEWPLFSTTGYVFLNSLNGIFIEGGNARAFNEIYSRFVRSRTNFQDIAYDGKRLVMLVAMASEVNTLAHYLNNLSEKDRHTRDFTLNSLAHAITEVIAFFPVYRTYINSYDVAARDRQHIEMAVAKAKRNNPAVPESIFDFLRDVLLLNMPEDFTEREKREWLDFVMRFQQITGPVMAKGVEDTAFYVYNRLVALNEVGGMPERFGTPLETFHGQNIERSKFWPHALLASTTHDTKRSEDVRARINVLSEFPEEWRTRLFAWSRVNRKKKGIVDGRRVPDRNEEYLFYQTLIGAWPAEETEGDERKAFVQRIKEYMLKATREAKVNTSWINPYPIYEEALMIFVDSVLAAGPGDVFLSDFLEFQRKVSHLGMFNSLSQALLKVASPGVPDFYQGTELWSFTLVDPDNRRKVDYLKRTEMLDHLLQKERDAGQRELCRELVARKEDGAIKLYVISRALVYRKANRHVFENGDYVGLEAIGPQSDHVCAFARRRSGQEVIAAVPRLLGALVRGPDGLPLGEEAWTGTLLVVAHAEAGAQYRNIYTGEVLTVVEVDGAHALRLKELFADFPVALLERREQ